MNRSRSPKLFSLQYLRAIAAIGVVFAHASTTLEGREGARFVFQAGSYGVDLFFVISGFVMFYTTAEKPITPGYFFLRRCIRIIPIYYIFTVFAFGLALLAPSLSKLFSRAPIDFLRSLLFIPYFNPVYQDIRPEVQQGWTLNYEMFFYVVFALCLWLGPKLRTWACGLTFAALAAIGLFTAPAGVYARTYTNPIILEFIFGIVIGYVLVMHQEKLARLALLLLPAAVAALVVGAIAFHFEMPYRVVFAGVPAFFVVASFIALERRGSMPYWPFFVLVGDASYSLYLIHTFVLSALKRVWAHVSTGTTAASQLVFMLVGLVAATFLALVFYRTVESPITDRLQAQTRKKVSQPQSRLEAVPE